MLLQIIVTERIGIDDIGVPFSVDSTDIQTFIESKWNGNQPSLTKSENSPDDDIIKDNLPNHPTLDFLDYLTSQRADPLATPTSCDGVNSIINKVDSMCKQTSLMFAEDMCRHAWLRKVLLQHEVFGGDCKVGSRGQDASSNFNDETNDLTRCTHQIKQHAFSLCEANNNGEEYHTSSTLKKTPVTLSLPLGSANSCWLSTKLRQHEYLVMIVASFDALRLLMQRHQFNDAQEMLVCVQKLTSEMNTDAHAMSPGMTINSRVHRITTGIVPVYAELLKRAPKLESETPQNDPLSRNSADLHGSSLSVGTHLESRYSAENESSGPSEDTLIGTVTEKCAELSHTGVANVRVQNEYPISKEDIRYERPPSSLANIRQGLDELQDRLVNDILGKETGIRSNVLSKLYTCFQESVIQGLEGLTKQVLLSLSGNVLIDTNSICDFPLAFPTLDSIPDAALNDSILSMTKLFKQLSAILKYISVAERASQAPNCDISSVRQKAAQIKSETLFVDNLGCNLYWTTFRCCTYIMCSLLFARNSSLLAKVVEERIVISKGELNASFIDAAAKALDLYSSSEHRLTDVPFVCRIWTSLTFSIFSDSIILALPESSVSNGEQASLDSCKPPMVSLSSGLLFSLNDTFLEGLADLLKKRCEKACIDDSRHELLHMVTESLNATEEILEATKSSVLDPIYYMLTSTLWIMLADTKLQKQGVEKGFTGNNGWYNLISELSKSETVEITSLYLNGLQQYGESLHQPAQSCPAGNSTCDRASTLNLLEDLSATFPPWFWCIYRHQRTAPVFKRLCILLGNLGLFHAALVLSQTLSNVSSREFLTLMVCAQDRFIQHFQESLPSSESITCGKTIHQAAEKFVTDKLWSDCLWSPETAELLLHLWYCRTSEFYETVEVDAHGGTKVVNAEIALAEAVRNQISAQIASLQNAMVHQNSPFLEDWCIQETLRRIITLLDDENKKCMYESNLSTRLNNG